MSSHPRWDPTARFLLAALAETLRAESVETIPVTAPVATPPTGIVTAAARHKMLIPVSDFVGPHAAVPGLRDAGRRLTAKAMSHAQTTLEVSTGLRDAGVEALFIKGVVLALQTTGRVNARGAGDIDVSVPHGELRRAVTVLESTGWQIRAGWPALASTTPPLHGHAVTLDRAGMSVDIHHRLDHAVATARVDQAALWSRRSSVGVAGSDVPTLDPTDAAAFIAVNSAQDAWAQLIRVADFLRLLALVERSGGDLSAVLDRGREWGAQGRVAVAVAVARRLRPNLPRQSPLAESLARGVWLRFAREDAIWNTGRLVDKARVDVFRLAATASGSYSWWWARRLAQRPVDSVRRHPDPTG